MPTVEAIILSVGYLLLVAAIVWLIKRLEQAEAFATMVKQRFTEAGINLDREITTDVKMPSRWVDYEELDKDEEPEIGTDTIRGKHMEWRD